MNLSTFQIAFNKPYLTGKEIHYIYQAVYSGKISGNGSFTQKCHDFFKQKFGFTKCLLTTSCTDALEMAAILANIMPGDEVIIPSYTFVSTANAFILRGARIIFADSSSTHPCIDVESLESLITSKTKAIVPVHYAGVACDMDKINTIAHKYNLLIIEDAAQAIDSYYKGKPLGSFGDFSTFSFHETKNIISGEGGMLVINNPNAEFRSEIIWEKGTNRSAFFRGEVDKYGWVDIGSSFLPSEIIAAFLYAQLENLDNIQNKRKQIWNFYNINLKSICEKKGWQQPYIPSYATNNAHMYYLILNDLKERTQFIDYMKKNGILCVFHYIPLHSSPYYHDKHDGRILTNCNSFSDRLVRLPLYYELENKDLEKIIDYISAF